MQNKFLYVLVEGPSKIMEIYQQKAGDGVPLGDVGLSAARDLPRMAGGCFIFQDQTSLLCEFGSSPTLEFL